MEQAATENKKAAGMNRTPQRASTRIAMILSTSVLAALPAAAQLPFFPGAEGYGGSFTGSAPVGGWFSTATVYHVTNLDDSGPGSFRGAFVENSTNKIVVFDVAGTINLTSGSLDIKNLTNYYIAGQTAPGPVTIYGNTTQITHSSNKVNSNVVLRYLAFRKGTGDGEDAITIANGGAAGIGTNIILDHVSASWAEDEDLSVAGYNTNITVQYSIIADALTSGHAYGSLIRPQIDSSVTYHHNLYANNVSRQARFGTYNGETLTADFRNNVIYNWRDRASYTGGSSESEQEFTDVNYVGNYLVAGSGTVGSPSTAFSVDRNVDSRLYQSGNYIDSDKGANPGGVPNGGPTPLSAYVISSPQTDQTLTMMGVPFPTAPVTTQTAPDAYNRLMQYVGNSWWSRDAVDTRIINNVKTNTGPPNGIGAAAPNAAELASVTGAPLVTRPTGWDTDNDGMPDAWEAAHGLNPTSAADNKLDFDDDGYINVIEYINEAGEFPAPAPIAFNGAANTRYANIMNWKTSDGVTAGSNWQPSKYDVAMINNGTVAVDAIGQHAGTLNVAPTAGNNATLNVTAGWIDVAAQLNVGAAGTAVVNHSAGAVVADAITLGGAVGASGAYNLSGSATLVVGTLSKGANGGAFNMTGGTLTAGTVAFSLTNNGGTIAPGASPGLMNVTGDLTNASGTLRMELAGTADGQYDKIAITGALHAGGILDIDLLGAFTPAAGDAFNLFDFTNSSGGFQLMLPALAPGLNWNSSNLLNTGVLSVTSALGPNADFNGDNLVDGADLLVWQRGLGLIGQSTNANGDADRNGSVNADDLQIVRNQFGTNPNATPVSSTVPEPSSTLLLVAACALVARRARAVTIAA
jgi:hypothetical protein